ncbi:hypothetical protein K439DRAFT_1072843 [Ramaria rubella]|nr:hypothetical protein K439DRAFT_1072843 [Ramaria rubella]
MLVYDRSLPERSWNDIPPGATVSGVEVVLVGSGASDRVGEEGDVPSTNDSGREIEDGGVNENESDVAEEGVEKAHGPDSSQLDQDLLKFLKDTLRPFLDAGGRFSSYKKTMDFLVLSESLVGLFGEESGSICFSDRTRWSEG